MRYQNLTTQELSEELDFKRQRIVDLAGHLSPAADGTDARYLRAVVEAIASPMGGSYRMDRTGTGTIGSKPVQARFPVHACSEYVNSAFHLPLLYCKTIHTPALEAELMWFLAGRSDHQFLVDRKCRIWDQWVKPDGTFGRVYGRQWRKAHGSRGPVDQLGDALIGLANNPAGRRHLVDSWQVPFLAGMALPPCHYAFQFVMREVPFVREPVLDIVVSQRSCDMFLGLPFNIASYGMLLAIFCRILDIAPGEVVMNLGDAHVYVNHIDAMLTYATRVACAVHQDEGPPHIDILRGEVPPPNYWVLPDEMLQELGVIGSTAPDPAWLTTIAYDHRAWTTNVRYDAGWNPSENEAPGRVSNPRVFMSPMPGYAQNSLGHIKAPVAV